MRLHENQKSRALFVKLAVLLLASLGCGATLAADLPPGLSRFNPAGLWINWQYEGPAFTALRTGLPGSVPVFRLNNPRVGYLLTASEAEAAAAQSQGFVREGTAFFALAQGGTPVLRFRMPHNGGAFYTTSRQEGEKAGFAYVGVAFNAVGTAPTGANEVPVSRYHDAQRGMYLFTAGRESPYEVGAFYFGSFTPSAANIINGTQRVYGRQNDWWGGVDDFYGKQPGIPLNTRGWQGQWPDLKPEIGYYDQSKIETLEEHINQAADAGLTFFSFYWYWSDAKHGELYPEALTSFLHARNLKRLKFNLTLYAHPWADDMAIDPSNMDSVAQSLVEYFANPQYLRLPDGRPVFAIGDDRNVRAVKGQKCSDKACSEQALSSFLDILKKRSQQTLGVVPFIEVQVGVPGWPEQPGEDAITCLVPPITVAGGTPYPQVTKDTFSPLLNTHKPVSPCMLQNFDERPRQDILIADRNVVRYLVGKTDDAFRHNLEVAKQVADLSYQTTRSPASRIVYLYAWNEWHEGGILEPNVHSDARDLNIVTDVFQLPRSPSICLDKGDCKLAQH
jgi:Glycosyltransferase WbsX/Repeat of unknown function (DUF5648)